MNVKTDINNVAAKPATLLKEEFINELTNLCYKYNFPLFVTEYILKDFIQDVHIASQRQLELDKANYEKQLQANSVYENASD